MSQQQMNLLTAVPAQPAAEKERPEPLREQFAKRKIGNLRGFKFYRWEALDKGRILKLTGCVVTRTYTKGKRAGRPAYDGPPLTVYITEEEMAVERQRHERETGQCCECMGTGDQVGSIDFVSGVTTYRPCSRCKGDGHAPAPAATLKPREE